MSPTKIFEGRLLKCERFSKCMLGIWKSRCVRCIIWFFYLTRLNFYFYFLIILFGQTFFLIFFQTKHVSKWCGVIACVALKVGLCFIEFGRSYLGVSQTLGFIWSIICIISLSHMW